MADQSSQDTHYSLKELRDRQRHLDSRQDEFSNKLANVEAKLSGELGEIRAMLSSALKNQEGVYSRLNRPLAPLAIGIAAVVLTLAGTFGTILTLTINPIKDALVETNIEHKADRRNQMDINMWLREDLEDVLVANSKQEEWMRWMEKMESRYDTQFGLSAGCWKKGGCGGKVHSE